MTTPVDPDAIECAVGARRRREEHLARWRPNDTVYVLHSADCRAETPDLTTCPYSRALDACGWDAWQRWRLTAHTDGPVVAVIDPAGFLVPGHPVPEENL